MIKNNMLPSATSQSSGRKTHQSLQRAIAIMRAFTENQPALTVAELSQKVHLHKSTVSRILSTLLLEGLVEHNEQTGHYSLGVGLITLAGVALGRVNVRATALPFMEMLASETGETVTLSILRGLNGVCVAYIPAPQSVRYAVWIGRRVPLHGTASGKVLLAHLTPTQRQAHLLYPLAPLTLKTNTDPDRLHNCLERVAQQGFALELDEFEEGISAIAAPVFDHVGKLVAAMSVAGPSYRLEKEQLLGFATSLKAQALAISERLGFG